MGHAFDLPEHLRSLRFRLRGTTFASVADLPTQQARATRFQSRETIIPYRRKRAAERGASALLEFYVRHTAHYVWRQICRVYVWFRKRRPGAPLAAVAAENSVSCA